MEGCEDAIVEEDVGEPAGHGTPNSGSRGPSTPGREGDIGERSMRSVVERWPALELFGASERSLGSPGSPG